MPIPAIRNRAHNSLLQHMLVALLVVLIVSGCVQPVKQKPVEQPVIEKPDVKPVLKPAPEPKAVVDAPLEKVILLLSGDLDTYQAVARRMADKLGDRAIQLSLSSNRASNQSLLEDIEHSDKGIIIALGLRAARLASQLPGKTVLFSHVVNYADFSFISDSMKGVSALPSPENVFRDWKAVSPGLARVAIVTGPNMQDFIGRAREAAKQQGIQISVSTVANDKEFLYASKKMSLDIQGQWIVPDNRILSSKALKEVMAYASRRGRQLVVFSPSLLSFGGLMYVMPDDDAIADALLQRLEQYDVSSSLGDEDISPVLQHKTGINKNIVKQFNLTIPEAYRALIHGE